MHRSLAAVLGALAVALAGCGGGTNTTSRAAGSRGRSSNWVPVKAALAIHLSSPAFASGARIPTRYTCAGQDVSPPLRWTKVPTATKAMAVLMVDPNAPGGPFTHWALAGVPPTARTLSAGSVPAGAVAGRNGFGNNGYGGPCPPAGKAHHYVIELLALPRRDALSPGFASGELTGQRPLAAGVLRATYSQG